MKKTYFAVDQHRRTVLRGLAALGGTLALGGCATGGPLGAGMGGRTTAAAEDCSRMVAAALRGS